MDTSDIHELLHLPAGMTAISEVLGRKRLLSLIEAGMLEQMIHSLEHELREATGSMIDEALDGEDRLYGCYREVIAARRVVYKLPATWRPLEGVCSNICEAELASSDGYCGPVAPCRIVWHETGIPIIVMEYVQVGQRWLSQPDFTPEQRSVFPREWAARADHWQIGWSDAKAAWVAYDAGCPEDKTHPPVPVWLQRALDDRGISVPS